MVVGDGPAYDGLLVERDAAGYKKGTSQSAKPNEQSGRGSEWLIPDVIVWRAFPAWGRYC
jgi:hypothetical protein